MSNDTPIPPRSGRRAHEQRRYPRLSRPLDARWSGGSGGFSCRIADLSWGGCFIETLATPAIDEVTTVTLPVGERTVNIQGRVRYVHGGIGFAVQFDPLSRETIQVLEELLGPPRSGGA
jgi:hypothetical protein